MKTSFLKSPLMALVLGLAVAVGTQSFTSKRATTEYALDGDEWKPVSEIDFGDNAGQYRCQISSQICKGYFDDTNPPVDGSSVPLMQNRTAGTLVQNP